MATPNTIKCLEARAWGAELKPDVTITVEDGIATLKILIEPEPQVRQTGRSGSYNPAAIKYNLWKHACQRAIKECIRLNGLESSFPITGYVKLTAKIHVSISRRYKTADLGNYIKAAEDMINTCGREMDPKYKDATPKLPIWQDDRFVVEYGEGTGKYLTEEDCGWLEIIIAPREIKKLK